jgi:hypothetical protein
MWIGLWGATGSPILNVEVRTAAPDDAAA